jgi:hypothetical protein
MSRGAHLVDCHVANIARGEQEGTRHPKLPMLKILLVLKPKNIFYTTSGVYSDQLLYMNASDLRCIDRPTMENHVQCAPNACSAIRNSLTAVALSSKFSAEMAHLACFVACLIDSSSSLKGPCDDDAAGGGGAAG